MQTPDPNHLAFLQDIIKRMAENSFSLKKYSLIVLGAVSALADKITLSIAIAVPFILVMFMLLDMYYLMLERQFRAAYNEACKGKKHAFDLSPVKQNISFLGTITSCSIYLFYPALIAACIFLYIFSPH